MCFFTIVLVHVLSWFDTQLKSLTRPLCFRFDSYRIESQLNATARVLEIDAEFIHLPGIVIISFGDPDTKTSETKFIKASGGLELGKLHEVHKVYRKVVHDEISVTDGTQLLNAQLKSPCHYNLWQRMFIAAMCSGLISPLAFGGSFIDAFASGAGGCFLSFLQLHVAKNNPMYANIFECVVYLCHPFVVFAWRLGTIVDG